MPRSLLFSIVLATAAMPSPIVSQVCAGMPFTRGPQAYVSGLWTDGGAGVGGGIGFGGSQAFGRIGVGLARSDDFEGTLFAVSGEAGFPLRFIPGGLTICPAVGLSAGFGATVDWYGDGSLVLDVWQAAAAASVSVGAMLAHDERTAVVPFASIGLALGTVTGTHPDSAWVVFDRQATSWGMTGGVGLVFSDAVSVRVAASASLEGGPPAFQCAVGLGVGRKRHQIASLPASRSKD